MYSALRGHTIREIKTLARYVKKLRPEVLHGLLTALHDVYGTVPEDYIRAREELDLFLVQTAQPEDADSEGEIDPEEISNWFSTQLSYVLYPLISFPKSFVY
jgi:hypothetical protein